MDGNGNGHTEILQGQEVSGRNNKGQWIKGVTGNPGGFNKPSRLTIRDVLKFSDAEKSVEVLRANLLDVDPEVAHKAAVYILDQLFGKAKQVLEHTGENGGPIEITDARSEFERRMARIAEAGQPQGIPEAN